VDCTAAAFAGSCCAKAEPEHSGVVLAAASAVTKKPAKAFLIPGPKNRRFGNSAERVGVTTRKPPRITKSRLNLESGSLG